MRVARGCEYRELPQLQPPHTESDEMSLTLQDAHLEFTLVHDVMTQSTMYKIWLPHNTKQGKSALPTYSPKSASSKAPLQDFLYPAL